MGRACEPDRPRQGPTPDAAPTPAGSWRTPSDSPADAGSSLHSPRGAGRAGASLRARSVPPGADTRCPAPTPAGSSRTPSDSPAGAGSSLHSPRGAGRDGASLRARSAPPGADTRCPAPTPAGSSRTPSDSPAGAGSSLHSPRGAGRDGGEPASPAATISPHERPSYGACHSIDVTSPCHGHSSRWEQRPARTGFSRIYSHFEEYDSPTLNCRSKKSLCQIGFSKFQSHFRVTWDRQRVIHSFSEPPANRVG